MCGLLVLLRDLKARAARIRNASDNEWPTKHVNNLRSIIPKIVATILMFKEIPKRHLPHHVSQRCCGKNQMETLNFRNELHILLKEMYTWSSSYSPSSSMLLSATWLDKSDSNAVQTANQTQVTASRRRRCRYRCRYHATRQD